MALVSGSPGIGKTRLAAELAAAVQPEATVLYAAGSGAPDAALDAMRGAKDSELPTLLVLDDADDASPAVLEAAAALAAKPRDSALLLLVLHRDEQGPPAFADAAQRLRLRPLRVEAAAEIAELYAPAEGVAMPLETLMAESEGVPLRVHRAASGWAQAQAARAARGDRGKDGHRARRPAGGRNRGGGKRRGTAGRPRANQPLRGGRAAGSLGARGMPVPRARARSMQPTPSTSSAASGSSPTS